MRRRLMMQVGENALPAGYTAVEYLQSSGSQYIDTGYKYGADSGFELFVDGSSSDGTVIGAQDSKGALAVVFSDALYVVRKDTERISKTELIYPIKIVNKGRQFRVLDVIHGWTVTFDDSDFVGPDLTIYLYARHLTSGAQIASSTTKIYSCRFLENGSVVANLRPCLDPDGVPCFYDTVRQQKYANAGQGSFTWG